jgi:hypothetical protein
MRAYAYEFLTIVSAVVQILILVFLLQASFRKYFFLLTYVVLDLASSLSETVAGVLYKGWVQTSATLASEGQKLYTHLYWADEVVLDLLLFLMVIVLTYQALGESPMRPAAGKLLGAVVLVVTLLPFVLFHPTFTPWPKGSWFNSTSQLLNFGGAIMNLVLWTALIASKQRDPRLLTVSAGLGVAVTGTAISFGLQHMSSQGGLEVVSEMFQSLTHLGGLMIWCWAFRPMAKAAAPRTAFPSV